jgi:hypothetical protein
MDPSSKSFAEVARKLLEQNRLAPAQMQARLQQAQDADYWRALNPQLHIGAAPRADLELLPASDAEISKCVDSVARFGYFKLPPIIAPHVLQEMVTAVQRLESEDWPATLAMVYDEFWQLSRTSTALRLLEGILGPGFKQNSNSWTHHVRPARGSSGWHPHIDGLQDSKDRLSLWIPLTDATLDNGCMYVIPRDRMPAALLNKYVKAEPVEQGDAELMLQSSYAMPAAAGSMMGWGFDVMHWGSVCTGDFPVRISVALEFLSAGVTPFPEELPLIDGAGPPIPFAQRVHAIARGIVKYDKFEPLVARYKDLASQIVAAEAPPELTKS